MSTSIALRISKLEKELELLKMEILKETKDITTKTKVPKKKLKIEECGNKKSLEIFTINELKNWLKKRFIDFKNLTVKNEFIKLVWKEINISEFESEPESESDSETEYEYEYEYYYE